MSANPAAPNIDAEAGNNPTIGRRSRSFPTPEAAAEYERGWTRPSYGHATPLGSPSSTGAFDRESHDTAHFSQAGAFLAVDEMMAWAREYPADCGVHA